MQHPNQSTTVAYHSKIAVDLPIYRQTKSLVPVELDDMQPADSEAVRALLNHIITEELTYPQAEPLTPQAFADYWLKGDAFVVRWGQDVNSALAPTLKIAGAFYIKPNFPGRCSHICNAGFIVAPAARGQGIGRLMGEAMLTLAKHRGYQAVMYNLVFASNVPSLKLWESLGFQTIGRIPAAAKVSDGQYVDAVMLYKSLV